MDDHITLTKPISPESFESLLDRKDYKKRNYDTNSYLFKILLKLAAQRPLNYEIGVALLDNTSKENESSMRQEINAYMITHRTYGLKEKQKQVDYDFESRVDEYSSEGASFLGLLLHYKQLDLFYHILSLYSDMNHYKVHGVVVHAKVSLYDLYELYTQYNMLDQFLPMVKQYFIKYLIYSEVHLKLKQIFNREYTDCSDRIRILYHYFVMYYECCVDLLHDSRYIMCEEMLDMLDTEVNEYQPSIFRGLLKRMLEYIKQMKFYDAIEKRLSEYKDVTPYIKYYHTSVRYDQMNSMRYEALYKSLKICEKIMVHPGEDLYKNILCLQELRVIYGMDKEQLTDSLNAYINDNLKIIGYGYPDYSGSYAKYKYISYEKLVINILKNFPDAKLAPYIIYYIIEHKHHVMLQYMIDELKFNFDLDLAILSIMKHSKYDTDVKDIEFYLNLVSVQEYKVDVENSVIKLYALMEMIEAQRCKQPRTEETEYRHKPFDKCVEVIKNKITEISLDYLLMRKLGIK